MTFHPCPLSRHWPQTQTAVSMPQQDPSKVVDDMLETAHLPSAEELPLPWPRRAWEWMEPNRKTPCSACKKHDALPLLGSNRIACLDYKMKQIMSEEKSTNHTGRDFVQGHFRWAIRIDEFLLLVVWLSWWQCPLCNHWDLYACDHKCLLERAQSSNLGISI